MDNICIMFCAPSKPTKLKDKFVFFVIIEFTKAGA